MPDGKVNLPASVLARLHNLARERGVDYQVALTAYCFERFLYRLSQSAVRDRFVLKGAMLLGIWSDRSYRATRDLDLLRRTGGSNESVVVDIRAICATAVPPDAVDFEADTIRAEEIRAEDEYAGTRIRLVARIGTARLPLQNRRREGRFRVAAPDGRIVPYAAGLSAARYPRVPARGGRGGKAGSDDRLR